MNNWCICWFFTRIFIGILIFKGVAARRLYKSFTVKGLITQLTTTCFSIPKEMCHLNLGVFTAVIEHAEL
jgi:hypothetical protein